MHPKRFIWYAAYWVHVHLLYYFLYSSKICHNLNKENEGIIKQSIGKCKQKENKSGLINIYMLKIKIKITKQVKESIT